MKFTKREILGILLIFVIGLLSLGAWQSFFVTIMTPGVSDIWRPVLWFSLVAIFFFLGAIVWSRLALRAGGVVFIFLSGLPFIHTWEYIAGGIVSLGFIFWSSMVIARETEERVHFHFYRSVRTGTFLFIVGLSLILSSGYYVFLKSATWEEMVPRFRIGEEMTQIIFKVAGAINPSFAKLSDGNMTVDEFLMSLGLVKPEENSSSQTEAEEQAHKEDIAAAFPEISQYMQERGIVFSVDGSQEKNAEALSLQSGRGQVETLAGREVGGNEKIADIFSLALQNKLITFLSGGKSSGNVPSQGVSFFLSLALFLTLLSFASLLGFLCILVAQLIFLLLLYVGWLALRTIDMEQEKLED